jgi:hypothetical protein
LRTGGDDIGHSSQSDVEISHGGLVRQVEIKDSAFDSVEKKWHKKTLELHVNWMCV